MSFTNSTFRLIKHYLDEVAVLDKETPVISIIHAQPTGKLKFNTCKKHGLAIDIYILYTRSLSFVVYVLLD